MFTNKGRTHGNAEHFSFLRRSLYLVKCPVPSRM